MNMEEETQPKEIPTLEPDEDNTVTIKEELESTDIDGDDRVITYKDGRKARIPEGAILIVEAPVKDVNIG